MYTITSRFSISHRLIKALRDVCHAIFSNTQYRILLKLPQEPHIVLEIHPDIIDGILEHRDPLDAHPEGETRISLRVIPLHLEDPRVHHTRTEDLDPSGTFAYPASNTRTEDAPDIHLCTRFGKRKVTRPEPDRSGSRKHPVAKNLEHTLEIAE